MKNRYGLERAATNFKWWIIGVFSVIAIGTASAMYVGGELESALFEKLATDPTGTEGQVYYNTTEKKAKLYNGSAWTDFGSGDGAAGAGEINYNDDPDGASNWTELGDGVTVSTTVVETQIPRWPIKTQAVLLTNDTTGTSGWSVCVEVGEADRNKKLKIEWAQIISTSPAYASGEFTYQLVSETNATCTGTETGVTLHSSGTTSAVAIPAQNGVMYDEFDADDSQYYELKFVRASGASASFIGINDLVIGPGKLHSGAVVTAWESFTPTWTGDTGSTESLPEAHWRIEGDSVRIRAYTRFTTVSGSGTFSFDVNDNLGFTIADDYLGVLGRTNLTVGSAAWYDSGATNTYPTLRINVTSGNEIGFLPDQGSTSLQWSDLASNDQIGMDVLIPVVERQGSGVLSTIVQDNLTEWESFTPSFNNDTALSATVNARKRRVGDHLEISFDYTPSGDGTDVNPFTMNVPDSLTSAVQTGVMVFGTGYGIDEQGANDVIQTVQVINDSSNIIRFYAPAPGASTPRVLTGTNLGTSSGRYRQISVNFKLPITEWAGSQSSLVGFTAATATQSGLVSTGDQTFSGAKTFQDTEIFLNPATGGSSQMYFQNNDISSSGFRVGIGSNEIAYLLNSENTEMQFWTNNLERMSIESDGDVLVNQDLYVTDNNAHYFHNAATSHYNAGLWQTDVADTVSCTTGCSSNEADAGIDTSSGTCLAGWSRASGSSISCGTTTGTKTCLCAGVNP